MSFYTQRYGEELRPPSDKNSFLSQLISKGEVTPEKLILFDDDRRNVQSAINNGFLGATVNAGEGISIENFRWYVNKAITRRD